jgi:uncharacterized repeat protein (TIGR03803 family)
MESNLSTYAPKCNDLGREQYQPLVIVQKPHSEEARFLLPLFFLFIFFLTIITAVNGQDVFLGLASDGGIEGKGTVYSINSTGSSFNVIKGFADRGQYPKSDLVKGGDGNFYGMTPDGGTYNYGTIFKITPTGDITVLKHFDIKADGGSPNGRLMIGQDGNFYGMTSNGGLYWGGVIFRLTPGGQYTILKHFSPNIDGYSARGHLVQAADGTFYGVTNTGGPGGNGTVFKYNATTNTFTVLKALNGTTEGGRSYGSLVLGSDGAFYGMTNLGGNNKYGVIFRITSAGAFSVIRHFNGATDGAHPNGDLILAKDGLLYGMTGDGGVNYNGTIFKINHTGSSFTVLQAMSAGLQGGNAKGSLLQATDGNFYGMAYSIYGGYSGCIFKMTASGGSLTAIKKFTSATEGGAPFGSLIQGSDGLLYGMTYVGGKYGNGTVF